VVEGDVVGVDVEVVGGGGGPAENELRHGQLAGGAHVRPAHVRPRRVARGQPPEQLAVLRYAPRQALEPVDASSQVQVLDRALMQDVVQIAEARVVGTTQSTCHSGPLCNSKIWLRTGV
jgi:hypothetical protein